MLVLSLRLGPADKSARADEPGEDEGGEGLVAFPTLIFRSLPHQRLIRPTSS